MTQHFHHLQSGAGLSALENHSFELLGFSRRQGAKIDPSLAWTQKLVGVV